MSDDASVIGDMWGVIPLRSKIFPGDHGAEETPDPIPNSEVKLRHAYGTAWEAVWESRSLPGS